MEWLAKCLKLTVSAAAIGVLAAQDIRAQDILAQHSRAEDRVGVLQVQGDAAAVHLELRGTTIKDVLTALSGPFNVSFRSAITLDEVRDGTYQGSLAHVIARVLAGYNYVVKYESSELDVIVFGKVGEAVIPAPQQHPTVRERREMAAHHLSCASSDVPDPDCQARLARRQQ